MLIVTANWGGVQNAPPLWRRAHCQWLLFIKLIFNSISMSLVGEGEDNIDDKYDNNGKYNSKNSDTSSMNVCALRKVLLSLFVLKMWNTLCNEIVAVQCAGAHLNVSDQKGKVVLSLYINILSHFMGTANAFVWLLHLFVFCVHQVICQIVSLLLGLYKRINHSFKRAPVGGKNGSKAGVYERSVRVLLSISNCPARSVWWLPAASCHYGTSPDNTFQKNCKKTKRQIGKKKTKTEQACF